MFVRSARIAGDGRPVVQGVGARLTRRGLSIDILHVLEPIRRGKLRVSLHDSDSTQRVTVLLPSPLAPGAYQSTTLEVHK